MPSCGGAESDGARQSLPFPFCSPILLPLALSSRCFSLSLCLVKPSWGMAVEEGPGKRYGFALPNHTFRAVKRHLLPCERYAFACGLAVSPCAGESFGVKKGGRGGRGRALVPSVPSAPFSCPSVLKPVFLAFLA